MKATLEKAGSSMANVLSVRVPLVDPAKNERSGPTCVTTNGPYRTEGS
jgi:enamine deaminase RidA (YjgF/YER057c/UK114 family)